MLERTQGGGGDVETLLEEFDRLENFGSDDDKLRKHTKILPVIMLPTFTKIHCCKEAMVTSSNWGFAWCLKCFDEYQNDWDGGGTMSRRTRRQDGNEEGAATVGKNVEPWKKCGAYTVKFMKDMYCEDNSGFLARNRTGERNVEKVVESCCGYGRVFWK